MKISKTLHALLAMIAAATVSTAALAGESPKGFAHESVGPAKTRAEVMSELEQARKDGTLHALWKDGTVGTARSTPGVTREEVRAELAEARTTGEYAMLRADEPARVQVTPEASAPAVN